jgi:hypothetical protein
VADALGQGLVGAHLARQLGQTLQQVRPAARRRRRGWRVARVEHAAVGQHEAHAGQRLVAVLRRAAAHAAGVVGGDAADHGRVDAGRVRPDLAAQRRQAPVGRRADDAGLQRDGAASADTRMPCQPSPSSTSTESLKAWPDRLVPAARNVSGVRNSPRTGQQAAHLGFVLDHHHQLAAPGGRSWRRCPRPAGARGR